MCSNRQPDRQGGGARTPLACEPCRRKKSKYNGEKPICSTCRTHSRMCQYQTSQTPRRKKHWDKEYVKSLEDQIKIQSEALSDTGLKALREFLSLNWAFMTQFGAHENIFEGPGKFSVLANKMLPMFEDGDAETALTPLESPLSPAGIADFAAKILHDTPLKQYLKKRFMECINPYYNFVDPSWLQFSDMFPSNDAVLQLLYSAVFAAAAYSSPSVSKDTARLFLAYAEKHIQQCYLDHLCLPVLQALLILAWLKHSMLDSRKGDLYKYMALGLSTHLGMPDPRSRDPTPRDIAAVGTFWSLFLIDRIASARLGCPSSIPWEMDDIPSYLAITSDESIDLPTLAFEYHCRLVNFQQKYVEVMYSSSFKARSVSDKNHIHAEATRALVLFRNAIDERLYMSRRKPTHKTQILFWIVYNSIVINMHRPVLDPSDAHMSHHVEPSLRAATAAADAIVQLTKKLESVEDLSAAPPFLAIHLLRAAMVHGVGATVYEGIGGNRAAGKFWSCMRTLGEVSRAWSTLAGYFMRFLIALAKIWDIGDDPMLTSGQIEESPRLETMMPRADDIQ